MRTRAHEPAEHSFSAHLGLRTASQQQRFNTSLIIPRHIAHTVQTSTTAPSSQLNYTVIQPTMHTLAFICISTAQAPTA